MEDDRLNAVVFPTPVFANACLLAMPGDHEGTESARPFKLGKHPILVGFCAHCDRRSLGLNFPHVL
jgi:hypothetical protein